MANIVCNVIRSWNEMKKRSIEGWLTGVRGNIFASLVLRAILNALKRILGNELYS